MNVVVYDEFEKFRQYKSPLFNYPYEKRKNMIGSFPFKYDLNYDKNTKNYEYQYKESKLLF